MLPELSIKITADPTNASAGFKEITQAQNALEAATAKHTSTRAKLDAAFKSGLTTEKAHAAAVKQSEEMYEAATRKAAAYANASVTVSRQAKAATAVMKNNSAQIANVGAQFNDIGVMMAAGQNPFMLAIQQGTQLNQVMAQMGGGKQALSGLAAGFTSMINPMSLATLGIIAGSAALVQWGASALGASEEAQELAEKLGLVEDRIADLNDELRQMQLGVTAEELTLLDAIAAKTQEISRISAEIETLSGRNKRAAEERLAVEQSELDTLNSQLTTLRDLQTRVEEVRASMDGGLSAVEALGAAISDLPDTFDPTIKSAQTLAATLWDAAAALGATMQQMAIVDQASTGGRGGAGPGGPMGAASLFEASSGGIHYGDFGASASAAGGGGGGGGSLDSLQDDLAAMQERFMSEQEIIDLSHDTELASLAEFRDAKLISMAGYNTLEEQLAAEHEDKLTEIQRAAQMARLSGWAGAFGDLSSLMSSENKKMQKIGEFAAKAQIGLEGIQSASSAWQKGMAIGGPPTAAAFAAMSVAKTAALMSQVGSSSGGSSSGGTSSSAATSSAESSVSNITNINANIAPNANYQGSVITDLFDMINQASADGNQIILRNA